MPSGSSHPAGGDRPQKQQPENEGGVAREAGEGGGSVNGVAISVLGKPQDEEGTRIF